MEPKEKKQETQTDKVSSVQTKSGEPQQSKESTLKVKKMKAATSGSTAAAAQTRQTKNIEGAARKAAQQAPALGASTTMMGPPAKPGAPAESIKKVKRKSSLGSKPAASPAEKKTGAEMQRQVSSESRGGADEDGTPAAGSAKPALQKSKQKSIFSPYKLSFPHQSLPIWLIWLKEVTLRGAGGTKRAPRKVRI